MVAGCSQHMSGLRILSHDGSSFRQGNPAQQRLLSPGFLVLKKGWNWKTVCKSNLYGLPSWKPYRVAYHAYAWYVCNVTCVCVLLVHHHLRAQHDTRVCPTHGSHGKWTSIPCSLCLDRMDRSLFPSTLSPDGHTLFFVETLS